MEKSQGTLIIEEYEKNIDKSSVKLGENYLIRTVTMIFTGCIFKETNDCFVLKNAAWIADAGRWNVAVRDAEFSEVEMYPVDTEVIVFKGSIVDMCIIKKLPTETV